MKFWTWSLNGATDPFKKLRLKDPAEVVGAGLLPLGVVGFYVDEIVLDVCTELLVVDEKENEDIKSMGSIFLSGDAKL